MLIPISYLLESACILASASASISCRPMVMTSSTVRSPTTSRITDSETSRRVCSARGPSKRNFSGIRDAVLNHPFHQCGVQVARHHLRFLLGLARVLVRIGAAWGREPEFLFQLPLDGNDRRDVNAEGQLEVQSWLNLLEISAEALHDGDGVARNGVDRPTKRPGRPERDRRSGGSSRRAGHRRASSV